MSRNFPDRPLLALTHGETSRYTVDLEAFFELSFTMAEQLENLVDDWSYFVRKRPHAAFRASSPTHRVKH